MTGESHLLYILTRELYYLLGVRTLGHLCEARLAVILCSLKLINLAHTSSRCQVSPSETFANRDVGGRAYRDVLVACF